MRMRSVALAALVTASLAVPALAGELGTPIDCSNLVLAPGLTCTTLVPAPAATLYRGGPVGSRGAIDNAGNVYLGGVETSSLVEIGDCLGQPLQRRPLLRKLVGDGWEPLIRADDRCGPFTREGTQTIGLHFDARGSLFAEFSTFCVGLAVGCAQYDGSEDRANNVWLARIDGFTPLADVLPPPPLPQPLCSNGLDDDGDGDVDAADQHCKSDADNDESRP